jgi:hypothetical protein
MSKRVAILKGSSILLLSLAYGCANTLPGGAGSPVSGAQLSGSGLISNNAGGLISNNAGGLISNNAGGLISNNAGGLISNNAGGLISNNAGGLISNNAGGLSGSVKGPSAGLISNNAGGLISNNAGGLISNNAGGLISNNAGGLISNNAGGYRTLATAADNFVLVPGAKVAVFNERNEMVSYGWSTVDKDGNYSFKRLKDSTHLLFLKAVYQVGDKQVTLMAVCKAPREAKTITANVDPATTLVAKKVLEMLRLRVVSVSTVKADSFTTMASQLAPVMTDAAAVLAVLQPPAAAAKTFDQAIGEVNVELPALKTQIAASVASAPDVITTTPEQVVVDSRNSPTNPTPSFVPGADPQPSAAPTQAPVDPTVPAPTGAVTTIEGLAESEFALTSAANIDADRTSGTLLVANGGKITSLMVQSTTQVGGSNEAADGTVMAVAASGTNRYYLTATKIVKPTGAVTLSGVSNPSDFVINGDYAYVTSQANHVVYKVSLSTGVGTVLAGSQGQLGSANGNAATTRFNEPRGIAFSAGALFVADSRNRVIRKLTLDGTSSTFSGSGLLGNGDGEATAAAYRNPVDLTVDAAGNFYIVDAGAGVIRKATSAGAVTTIAGNGSRATLDGTGAAASFRDPSSIALGTLDGHPILFVGQDDAQIRVVQNW